MQDTNEFKAFSDLAEYILFTPKVYKATKYLSETLTVKATRKRYNGKFLTRSKTIELIFTVGKPNYEEREFIKKCKNTGESFPVKKIQLKLLKD
jgi:hypothetical protein